MLEPCEAMIEAPLPDCARRWLSLRRRTLRGGFGLEPPIYQSAASCASIQVLAGGYPFPLRKQPLSQFLLITQLTLAFSLIFSAVVRAYPLRFDCNDRRLCVIS